MTARTTTPAPARVGREGRGKRLLRAVAYGIAFAVPVSLLALVAREKVPAVQDLDAAIILRATDVTRDHPSFRSALIVWQEIFQPWRLYVVATAICLWAWLAKHYKTRSWWAFATMMATWNLALDLKLLVQRARPHVENPVSSAPGWSFPSGHAANTAGAMTCLAILVWPMLSRGGRVAVGTIAGAVTVLTALDRVFLGVHYPTDVTAGVLVGCGIAVASYAGYQGWNPIAPDADEPPARLEAREERPLDAAASPGSPTGH